MKKRTQTMTVQCNSLTNAPGGTQQVVRRHAKDIAFMRRAIQRMRLRQGQTNARLFESRGRDER